jgi:hypothetical protein
VGECMHFCGVGMNPLRPETVVECATVRTAFAKSTVNQ